MELLLLRGDMRKILWLSDLAVADGTQLPVYRWLSGRGWRYFYSQKFLAHWWMSEIRRQVAHHQLDDVFGMPQRFVDSVGKRGHITKFLLRNSDGSVARDYWGLTNLERETGIRRNSIRWRMLYGEKFTIEGTRYFITAQDTMPTTAWQRCQRDSGRHSGERDGGATATTNGGQA